jgi:tetratricopeptide (TPR) repeat protein
MCLVASSALAQGDEAAKAEALYQSGNRLDALPLYEELARTNPKEPLYAERLAVCLHAQSAGMESSPARSALLDRIVAEAKTAVVLGSQDDAAQVIATFDLSQMNNEKGETLAKAIWRSGEPYFGRHDFKEALRRYGTAAELEPKIYEPALFAGDAAQFLGDLPTATHWYKKAIQNEPNQAKAYLRWGDAIARIAHDSDGAKVKYIDAIVANPYDPQGRQGLAKWAEAQGAVLAPPQIKPPSGPVEMLTAMGQDPATRTPWATYVVDKFAYETNAKKSPIGTFREDYPGEAKARRSLIEESKALHATALEAASKAEKQGKTANDFRDLIEVDKAGMLECWVLFHWADQNTAQEYPQFSKDHWKLLHDYVDRFEIHGGAGVAR